MPEGPDWLGVTMFPATEPTPPAAPLISILIRSTGRPDLRTALLSVAAQIYPSVEVLVADAAGGLALDLSGSGSNVRLISTGESLGRSAAANLLLQESAGQWALFLDDDDWIAPSHLSRLASVLSQRPDCIAAYSGVACIEEVESEETGLASQKEIRRYDDPFDENRLLVENFMPIHAVLFNLNTLREHAAVRFDEALDIFEDWDFWLKCAGLGPFLHVPGVSAYYKIHTAGLGVRMDEEGAVAALDLFLERWRQRYTPTHLRTLIGLGRTAFALQNRVAELEALNNEKRLVPEQLKQIADEECERSAQTLAEARQQLMLEHQRHVQAMADFRSQQSQLRDEQARLLSEQTRQLALTQIKLMELQELHAQLQSRTAQLTEQHTTWGLVQRIGAAKWLDVKAFASRQALRMATAMYRTDVFAPLVRRVPFAVKRLIRDRLMKASAGRPDAALREEIVTKRVSLIVPIYNHARYLERCLLSALSQDWLNLEVLAINDGSTDPAVERILQSLEGEPRLRIIRHARNRGISEAQNSALEASNGEVIAFLDCDDYLPSHAISRCMASWAGDTVYLHTGRINVDENDLEVSRIHFAGLPRKDYFSENLQGMYATHLKLIRRGAFAKVGLFDPRFDAAQDYEMLMRIAFHYPSSSFIHVPEFLYFHRIHPNQATERQRVKQNGLTVQIQKEARLRADIRDGRYGRFLSIIMLSYGKHSQTLKAIQSLKATVKVPHEIILYDNGSVPETVAFLKSRIDGCFDGVRVIYGDRNLGPAQGRRKALDYANGEWMIVFDNDEWAEPGWIEELLLRAECNSNVGAVCCRVVFPDQTLQFSGGMVRSMGDSVIDLALHDRGARFDELSACRFREVDWCPIGATLFTVDIRPYLHEGYPNVFEDAGVSFALKRQGLRLLNAPGALVWHDHVSFMPSVEMGEQYMRDRYHPQRMLQSVASFYKENGLLIHDEYVWRENGLSGLSRRAVLSKLGLESVQECPVV